MSGRKKKTAAEMARIMSEWDTDDDLADEENVDIPDTDFHPPVVNEMAYESSSDESSDDNPRSSSSHNLPSSASVIGRDGTVWTPASSCASVGRTPTHNLFTAAPGCRLSIQASVTSPYDAWKHYIDESILRQIVAYTNEEAERRGESNFSLTLLELESFLALLYARGLYGKNHPVALLWNRDYGIQIFGKTMSRDRFISILKYLRFDDKPKRLRNPNEDHFMPIREVFDKFVGNCQSKFTCNYSLTVDEQLLPLKTRCRHITYMPNKPDKYGLKFWLLVDVVTKYVINIIPYLGAQERNERGDAPLVESVVLKLIQPIRGRGYNVCCDNFFTSLPLAEKLASQHKTSIVGTIRKNRRELCDEMTNPKKGGTHESTFFQHSKSKALFVKYQTKEKKRFVCCRRCIPLLMWEKAIRKSRPLSCFITRTKLGWILLTKCCASTAHGQLPGDGRWLFGET